MNERREKEEGRREGRRNVRESLLDSVILLSFPFLLPFYCDLPDLTVEHKPVDVFLLCTSGGSFCASALDGNKKGSQGATSNVRACTGRRLGSEQEEEGDLTRHTSPRWLGLKKRRVLRVNSPELSHWFTYGNERIQILPKAHSSSLAT